MKSVRFVAVGAAMYALLGGAVTLLGWWFDWPRLTDWNGDGISMLPNAALAAVASGLAVLGLVLGRFERKPKWRWAVWLPAGLVTLVGGLTLLENVTGIDFRIDRLLVEPQWGRRATMAPGRMGSPASMSFLLMGIAMLLAASELGGKRRRLAALLMMLGIIPSVVASTAYLYGADPLFSMPRFTGIALQTATIIFALGLAMIIALREFGLGELLHRDDSAGTMVRQFLPITLVVLLATGWLEDLGLRYDLYDTSFGNAILTVIRIVMFTALVWWTARTVTRQVRVRSDAERALRETEKQFELMADSAPVLMWTSGPDMKYTWVNKPWLDFTGREPADELGRGWVENMHPADRDRFIEAYRSAFDVRQSFTTEYRFRRADGEYRWLLHTGVPRYGEDGRFAGYIGSCTDVTESKRVERVLRETEERTRMAVESAEIGTWDYNLVTGTLRWSTRCKTVFGLAPNAAVSYEVFLERLHPDDRDRVHEVVQAALDPNGDGRYEVSYRAEWDDGTVRWIVANGRAFFEGQGANRAAVRFIGTVLDITDRKTAERARQQFVSLAESSNEFVGMFDQNLNLYYINSAGIRMVGLDSQEEAFRTPVDQFFFPDDAKVIRNTFLPRVRREGHGELETRFRHFKTGEELWVIYTAVTLTNEDGEITGFGTVTYDITERKIAEQALRQSEERFRELANNIDQFAWTCDKLGQGNWYNQRWYDYTGTTFADMQGEGWKALHHPGHIDRVVEGMNRAAELGEPWEDTFPLRGSDGRFRWFLSRAVPIKDESGKVIRWFGTNTDVTQQRRLADALRKADIRKDDFLAMLAHELRNPLAAIRTALPVMRSARDDEEMFEEMTGVLDRQTRHLVRLIDDLLDVSRITRGKIALQIEQVDMSFIVGDAVEACRPLFEPERQRVVVRLPQHPIVVDADPVRMTQVVTNLINNASKYSGQEATIRIEAMQDEDEVVLEVSDNGLGIPPDKINTIFEMFSQVESGLDRSRGGLGIGLTLVQRLVEMQGGSVQAFSDGLGCGSKFVVRLPVAAGVPAKQAPPSEEPGHELPVESEATVARRILIVDDNVDGANTLATLLRMDGHEIHVAYDGEDGVLQAADKRPEIILLDIGLPKMNGYDVCRELRKQTWGEEMMVCAMTGWGQTEDKQRAIDAGFDIHMTKPIEYDELSALLMQTRDAMPSSA